MLCGPIVSGNGHELPCPAHHQSGDITEVTRVVRTRLKTAPHGGTTAPAAAQPSPLPAAVGAFINTPVHGEDF